MDFWQKARVFAEEAAKRTQSLSIDAAIEATKGAAKFSQEFASETAKKSKELAAEASKKADQIKVEAFKRADQIKNLAGEIEIPIQIQIPKIASNESIVGSEELERFGVTDELREFVKGITIDTFRDFPMQDEPEASEVPTVSNIRQDLNEWQARHATLVLSSVKEISKFRYELCPRYMKERKFWRIYFILVNNYVSPYEKQYNESLNIQSVKQNQIGEAKDNSSVLAPSAPEAKLPNLRSKTSTAEQDLDVFLLGDLGSSDEDPDVDDDGFDDDFDKIESNSGLESDDEKSKTSK